MVKKYEVYYLYYIYFIDYSQYVSGNFKYGSAGIYTHYFQ